MLLSARIESAGRHKVFIPKRSGPHRQAAIALYRALLLQCRAVPFREEERVSLQNIVRNRFRANRELQSSRKLKIVFTAGYRAIDHLDGCAHGDGECSKLVASYLSKVPEYLKQAPRRRVQPPKETDPASREPPPEHKFLNVFPRPAVSGIRKAPFFVSANGLPFVRWKKPQPVNVSRSIRQLLDQKFKRIHRAYALSDFHIPLAEYEDQWDDILAENCGYHDSIASSWATVMSDSLNEVELSLREREEKSDMLAEKMLKIVNEEKRLVIKERLERKRLAKERRRARKAQQAVIPSADADDAVTVPR